MKSHVISRMKAIAFAGLVAFLAIGSSNSFASATVGGYTFNTILPGIVPPSLPAFGTGVEVKFTKGSTSSTLKASYEDDLNFSVLAYPNTVFSVKDTKYTLNANYNGSGVFQNGTVKIEGKIAGLGINTFQTLMTANLTAFAKSSSGFLYGFNTNNIVCNPLINAYVQCTTAESVYLALFSAQKSLTKSWSSDGIAITSIPIPAAAWLLGSGLLGLVGIARRKKKSSV